MASSKKDYFGIGYIPSLILCIIPFTAWILGAITRFKEGHWVCAIIRLIGLGMIIWILDLFFMITQKKIFRIA